MTKILGSRKPIISADNLLNIGCSHANAYELDVSEGYAFKLATKLGVGLLDYSYPRVSLEYCEYVFNFLDKPKYTLWQLTYPWRKHNWNTDDRHEARINIDVDVSLEDSFKLFASILKEYKNTDTYFLFIDQEYVSRYMKDLRRINNRLYPQNFSLLDTTDDEKHGGVQTQTHISDKLYEFITNDQTN